MPTVPTQPYFLTPTPIDRRSAPQPEIPARDLFIYLPGMDCTGQLFRTQVAEIGAQFDIRCLAIPPMLLLSWQDLTAQVVKLIEAEIAQRADGQSIYLCGESFGGCLALQVATHSPKLFDRLILVNPAIAFQRQPWLGWGGQIMQWIPDLVYDFSAVGFLPFLAALERYNPIEGLKLLEAMQTVPKATSMWRMSLLQTFELERLALDRLAYPVLAIASGADRLLPSVADARYLLSKLPQGELVVLPDSGHACLLEREVSLYGIMQERGFLPLATPKKIL
jgi:pimeloyl-ACP methyl ester carboxylesterase